MVRGILLSLCRHRWWYPVGDDGEGDEQSPLHPALHVSSPVCKAFGFRVREASVQVWLVTLGRLFSISETFLICEIGRIVPTSCGCY